MKAANSSSAFRQIPVFIQLRKRLLSKQKPTISTSQFSKVHSLAEHFLTIHFIPQITFCSHNIFNYLLPKNNGEFTYKHTEGACMKYVVEMGSDAMIYVPSFITIDLGIQKLTEEEYTDTQITWCHTGLHLFIFFLKKGG